MLTRPLKGTYGSLTNIRLLAIASSARLQKFLLIKDIHIVEEKRWSVFGMRFCRDSSNDGQSNLLDCSPLFRRINFYTLQSTLLEKTFE